MIADIAIHLPHRDGDHRNHHAHVMLTMRGIAGEGFGGKVREWNDRALLAKWREQWAAYQNVMFEELGLPLRADHRSLDDRGINREPEPKLGPKATAMDRKGKDSTLAAWRKAVRERNAERQQLEHEAKIIDLELKRKEKEAKAKHVSAAALDKTRSAIRQLEAFDRGHEVINHFTREITRALSASRRLEHRRKYAEGLARGVENNFHRIFRDRSVKALERYGQDIERFGIFQAVRMLRYDPRRYGHLPGWKIGNLFRSKDRRAALRLVEQTAELSRQAFFMNRKIAGDRVDREALADRIEALKAEQREAFKSPPEGRLLIQRMIEHAAYRLRSEDWRTLTRKEKYHLMQARELMRDPHIRRWADGRLAPYLDQLAMTPQPAPGLSMRRDPVDLKKVSPRYHRTDLEERKQAMQERHTGQEKSLRGRHQDEEQTVRRERGRRSFIALLAMMPGVGDLIERRREKRDAQRHARQTSEQEDLRARQNDEARMLADEQEALAERERHDKDRIYRTGARQTKPERERGEHPEEITGTKGWKKNSADGSEHRRKRGRGYGYKRPGPKGGGKSR